MTESGYCQMLGLWIQHRNHIGGRNLTLKVIDLQRECMLLLVHALMACFYFVVEGMLLERHFLMLMDY
uniref:Uncharacterized protein n=1 Tax=Arundo donax TaxID=35708 RepID=A0A0A8YFZ0_ARUDO